MPTASFYIYDGDALPYDPNTGTFTFDPNYDHTEDRVLVEVDDPGGQYLDGDRTADEVGEDTNQTAVIYHPDGTVEDSGQIYAEEYAQIQAPDGTIITIDRIEIAGRLIGYSPSQLLTPGVTYTYVGGGDIDNDADNGGANDTRLSYSQYEAQSVPCFVSGTMLLTREGMRPVDWIEKGDELWTQDHGWQTVRWRGLRQFEAGPDFPRPIEFQPGALGPGAPSEVLRVSPQHRILLSGPACMLLFAQPEVLVAAKHLLHWGGVSEVTLDRDYAYHHFLFDRHEVLSASGVALESLFLGEQVVLLRPAPNWVLRHSLAEGHIQTARLCLTARQARALRSGCFPATHNMPQMDVAARIGDAAVA